MVSNCCNSQQFLGQYEVLCYHAVIMMKFDSRIGAASLLVSLSLIEVTGTVNITSLLVSFAFGHCCGVLPERSQPFLLSFIVRNPIFVICHNLAQYFLIPVSI